MKITMAAPFEANGRYKGGIHSIVNAIEKEEDLLARFDAQFTRFETCRINRAQGQESAINASNVKNFLKIYADLPKELKDSSATCLYYHSSVGLALLKDLLAMRKAKRKAGISTVLHIHFADYEKIMTGKAPLDALILRLMKRYVDRIVFLSRKTMTEFIAHGISEDRCQVVYNFSTVEYRQDEIDGHLKHPAENAQFLFVGSIDERKGLFDALACMTDMKEDFTLHVCGGFGSETDRERFNSFAKQLGDKLIYHGYVDGEEKHQLFLNADVLLLPSYGEGLPVVILEAFSAACGVITTNVGAIPEIVGENNGYVISPGDQEALREAITAYIGMDADALAEQKQGNYLRSKEFTISNFIEAIGDACHKAEASSSLSKADRA